MKEAALPEEVMSNGKKGNRRVLGVFTLCMINVAAVLSLRNFPVMSEYGLGMIFYYSLSALFFLVPVSLVSAELATTWPVAGGVYVWVREAMGERMGFLAIWAQTVNNVFFFPTMMAFIAGTLAYCINPAYANNKIFTLVVLIVGFWGLTLINLRGTKISGLISSFGAMAGTIIPGSLLVLLGAYWLISGRPSATPLNANQLIPHVSSLGQLVFLAGALIGMTGMEMSAVHAQEVKDPRRNYPLAILLSAVIVVGLSVFGSMAVALVIPRDSISLDAGIMEAFRFVADMLNLSWAIPILALLVAIGGVAKVSTWVAGPPKGLLATAHGGSLPPLFQKVNRQGMPVSILMLQAVMVTLFGTLFLLAPTVNTAFWILTALTVQVYLVMYLLLFAAAIILRYKYPNIKRPYRVPGGMPGIWIIGVVGFLSSVFGFAIGFVQPIGQTINYGLFELCMVGGIVLMLAPPFIFHAMRKPHWDPAVRGVELPGAESRPDHPEFPKAC